MAVFSRQRILALAGIAVFVAMVTTKAPLQTRAFFMVPLMRMRMRQRRANAAAGGSPSSTSSSGPAIPQHHLHQTPAFVGSSCVSKTPSRTRPATALSMADDDASEPEQQSQPQQPQPTTFREAEVLGLKFMQEGNYEDALKGSYWTIAAVAVSLQRCSMSCRVATFFDSSVLLFELIFSAFPERT